MPLVSGVPRTKSVASSSGAAPRTKPAEPEVSSVTFRSTVTGTKSPLGGQSVAGVGAQVTVGGVASRAIVTDAVDTPPRFVAVHVNVVPVVSAVIVALSHPSPSVVGDSIGSTFQLTVTLPTYQPFAPSAPMTC